MPERLYSSAALAGPEPKHDLRKLDHVAISKSAGALTSGKLQFDDPINLLQPWLNPLRLFAHGIWNHSPTDFIMLSQPFHGPLIDPAGATDQPGSTLMQEGRKMLLKQTAGGLAIDVSGSRDRYRQAAGRRIRCRRNS